MSGSLGTEEQAAKAEAANHAIGPRGVAAVQSALRQPDMPKRVQDHSVRILEESWSPSLNGLGVSSPISRADVYSVARRVEAGEFRAEDLFAATYAWGQGTSGYGPFRLQQILTKAGPAAVRRSLERAIETLRADGPVAAYGWLAGRNGATGLKTADSGHLLYWGPAFFTKFLYFASTPGGHEALILDAVLARKIAHLSGLPHFSKSGWSPYRYAVYLSWMRASAEVIPGIDGADHLEMVIFKAHDLGAAAPMDSR
jgi:hypothetical protein